MERLVVAALVSLSATAIASSPSTSPYQQNRPGNIVEQRVMHDLACTCPTCNHLPLDECGCDLAAKLRGEVKERLRGADLSTADRRDAAYAAVRAAFAARHGNDVLTPRPEARTDPRMSWLPVLILVGGVVALVLVTRRSLRRRRAAP